MLHWPPCRARRVPRLTQAGGRRQGLGAPWMGRPCRGCRAGRALSRGHEMFHDDMIMYVIINDQQSFMATINISSA